MHTRAEVSKEAEVHRKALISYVYRLTGSYEEAKDITQECLLKYLTFEKEEILNSKAWMFKVATNLSRDFLKSARNTKESYIGPWLPEPYIEEATDTSSDLELDESLSIALMIIIQTLSIKERAAYILHDILEFKHKEIASLLDINIESSRQLSSRANKKIKSKQDPSPTSSAQHNELSYSFLDAIKTGNTQALINIFQHDVQLLADGGGKVSALKEVLYGDNTFIANFLINVLKKAFKNQEEKLELKSTYFNGSLGLLLFYDNKLETAYSFEINENKIAKIFVHRNPDKLELFN